MKTYPRCICPGCGRIRVCIPDLKDPERYVVRSHNELRESRWASTNRCPGSHEFVEPATEQEIHDVRVKEVYARIERAAHRIIDVHGPHRARLIGNRLVKLTEEE